jgi:hypothetical protein
MNALQEEDAVSLDYNPVVEGVMGGLIPSTSRSMRVESSSLQQMELQA